MNAVRCALAIPVALLLGAAASRALLAHAPAIIAVDLAQPLTVVTNWHGFGAALFAVLFIALALSMGAYACVLRSAGDLSLRWILAIGALAIVAAWCVPVLFSSDVYAYAAYGEIARLGGNPYGHAALARGNPVFDAAVWQWGNPPPVCVYGPLFVAVSESIVAAIARLGIVWQLDGLRALASLALLGCSALAYAAYPGDRRARLTAAATIGLNPVAIWCAAEGHNDALVLFVVLAGFALLRRGVASGAAVVALSALLKLSGAAAAVALAFADRRARIPAAIALLPALVLSIPLLQGVLTHLAPSAHYAPQASLQAAAGWAIAVPIAAILALRAVALLRNASNEGWAWFALAAWALIPNPYPWYALALIAIAALVPRTPAGNVLLLFSLASLLRYLPDASGTPSQILTIVLGLAASLPFAALLRRRQAVISP